MKFTITRDNLLQGLQFVIGVVERRQNIPILANILLNLSANHLSLTATDHETQLEYRVETLPSEDHKEGKITVSGRKLMDICRQFSSEHIITFKQENNKILLQVEKSRFTLTTLPAEDFPLMNMLSTISVHTLDRKMLQQLIMTTIFAIAEQDVRYYMNGLFFDLSEEGINTVATDGHRLALCRMNFLPEVDPKSAIFILPRKAVTELLKILNTENREKLSLKCAHNAIKIETESFVFFSRLIDGNFPNYRRVIPQDLDKTAIVDRDLFKQILQRLLIFTTEKYYAARLFFKNNILSFYSHNTENEEAVDELEINYNGPEVEIAFNIHYLLDVLAILPSGEVNIHFAEADKSVLINSSALKCVTNVIMPMSL